MRGAETQHNQTAWRRPTLLRLWMSRTEPPFIGKVGSADMLPVAAHAFSHEPVFLQALPLRGSQAIASTNALLSTTPTETERSAI
jgi:hypothetical protein